MYPQQESAAARVRSALGGRTRPGHRLMILSTDKIIPAFDSCASQAIGLRLSSCDKLILQECQVISLYVPPVGIEPTCPA